MAAAWKQVYCAPFGSVQNVYLLDLSNIGLSGRLDDTVPLGNLTRLQALWLSGNELQGPLPKSWGVIKTLQVRSTAGHIADATAKAKQPCFLQAYWPLPTPWL